MAEPGDAEVDLLPQRSGKVKDVPGAEHVTEEEEVWAASPALIDGVELREEAVIDLVCFVSAERRGGPAQGDISGFVRPKLK